jgi:hypothetical protein
MIPTTIAVASGSRIVRRSSLTRRSASLVGTISLSMSVRSWLRLSARSHFAVGA